jgi:O-methyltransferase
LIKKVLTRYIAPETYAPYEVRKGKIRRAFFSLLKGFVGSKDLEIVRRVSFNTNDRIEGRDRPSEAVTMIGLRRLDNLETCITNVLREDVPGDLIETGVWRGGASIFMRSVLKAYGCTNRTVWVADSFKGLPPPKTDRFPADAGNDLWKSSKLVISLEEVKENFARYDLLDRQVRFLVGWFCDTLPTAPIKRLAVARLDGDMYESTMDALRSLYPKVSTGGYLIIDDYWCVPACSKAVEDYRKENGITEEIHRIDWSGVYWKKMT